MPPDRPPGSSSSIPRRPRPRSPPSASTPSVLLCGVEVLELDAGVGGGEAPVDPTVGGVSGGLPRGDLAFQGRAVGQPAVQALPGEHAQLDLGYVQPAAVLGSGV